MKRVLPMLVLLAWALWLGGLVTLFAAVGTIFGTAGYEREVQGAFAARLFQTFERMQLVFAAVSLLATAAWWLAGRQRQKLVLFWLLAACTLIAVVETTVVTPRVEHLRQTGQRGTPAFESAHQASTKVYLCDALTVLLAGYALLGALRAEALAMTAPPAAPPRTSEETAPA